MPFDLGTIDWALLGLLGLALSTLILAGWVIRLELRLRSLLSGSDGKSLEGAIQSLQTKMEENETFHSNVERALNLLHKRIQRTVSGVATVRFDAFAGTGSSGRQSFATALLSERGDGVVVSSMHAREHTRVFAKPLHRFASEFELTEEERAALADARKNISA